MSVRFFLDTASLTEIEYWHRRGLVDGVTTNAALLAESQVRDVRALLATLDERYNVPVCVPVLHSDAESMIETGRELARLSGNVLVKIPATDAGYLAARQLIGEGVRCTITFVFDPATAIAFLRLNPAYLAIILDRNEDFGTSWQAESLLADTLQMTAVLESSTQIIAASIRHPKTLCHAVSSRTHVITVPPKTWATAAVNPLTVHEELKALNTYSAWRESSCNSKAKSVLSPAARAASARESSKPTFAKEPWSASPI